MRVAINGFGRIGRMITRALITRNLLGQQVSLTAISDVTTDASYLAYLLRHDSVHGPLQAHVSSSEGQLLVNGHSIKSIGASESPKGIHWQDIDVVIEATGRFTNYDLASGHLQSGVRKVIVTAVPSSPDIKTIVLGVNHHEYDPNSHHIVSTASCTANCILPLLHVIQKSGIGIEKGYVTTLLPYTASRKIVDGPSDRGWRDGRAAALNVIPSSVGASKAVFDVIPELKGKITDMVFRVPVPDVSLIDMTIETKTSSSIQQIDSYIRQASESHLKNILDYSREPLVSSDFINNPHSSIYDSLATLENNLPNENRLFKLVAWYDNEWGYANRVVDMLLLLGGQFQI